MSFAYCQMYMLWMLICTNIDITHATGCKIESWHILKSAIHESRVHKNRRLHSWWVSSYSPSIVSLSRSLLRRGDIRVETEKPHKQHSHLQSEDNGPQTVLRQTQQWCHWPSQRAIYCRSVELFATFYMPAHFLLAHPTLKCTIAAKMPGHFSYAYRHHTKPSSFHMHMRKA